MYSYWQKQKHDIDFTYYFIYDYGIYVVIASYFVTSLVFKYVVARKVLNFEC